MRALPKTHVIPRRGSPLILPPQLIAETSMLSQVVVAETDQFRGLVEFGIVEICGLDRDFEGRSFGEHGTVGEGEWFVDFL